RCANRRAVPACAARSREARRAAYARRGTGESRTSAKQRRAMKIETHIDKFHRLDAALGRLRPDADCELWIWTAMNACVNLLNAALHRARLTEETDSFHTQVEGLY